jgi:hypothetical protein
MMFIEKEAISSSFIDLTKRGLDIEESSTKATMAEPKLLVEQNRIMLANLSIMAPEQKAWFETKQAIIHECDA